MTDPEARTAAVVALARAGIQTDIQELLIAGDPMRGIPPGALDAALLAYATSLPQSQDVRALVERLLEMAARFENGLLVPSLEMTQREGRTLVALSRKAAEALSCLAGEGWRPISELDSLNPVLVSRPTDNFVYTPTTAFKDATGVWRLFRSPGGMQKLQFAPTHFRPLPAAPSVEEKLP